eukprot:559444-Prymnesium_polylepis.1
MFQKRGAGGPQPPKWPKQAAGAFQQFFSVRTGGPSEELPPEQPTRADDSAPDLPQFRQHLAGEMLKGLAEEVKELRVQLANANKAVTDAERRASVAEASS